MEKNKIHNIDFLDNTLPDKCANLIIADPPYFEVKGEFDFVWKSFDDYLKDVECWAKECKRLLADNGTLFWYGSAKRIAYAQIIFDKHFNFINSLVWENTNPHKQQIRFSEGLKSFAPLTERILMYSNEVDMTGLEIIMASNECFVSIKKYLDDELEQSGYTLTTIKNVLGNRMGMHYFGFSKRTKTQFQLPTEKQYLKLQTTGFFKKTYEALRKEYEALRKEYEALRKEYEAQRRPFDNFMNLGDVIKFPNFETGNYNHDTVKPEKLTRALILTCSRKDDLVVVPFAGSGTECAMAAKEKRQFVGFEINANYSKIANQRAAKILSEPTLF